MTSTVSIRNPRTGEPETHLITSTSDAFGIADRMGARALTLFGERFIKIGGEWYGL